MKSAWLMCAILFLAIALVGQTSTAPKPRKAKTAAATVTAADVQALKDAIASQQAALAQQQQQIQELRDQLRNKDQSAQQAQAAAAEPAGFGDAHLVPGRQPLDVGGKDVARADRHAHAQDRLGEELVGRGRARAVDVGELHHEGVDGLDPLRHFMLLSCAWCGRRRRRSSCRAGTSACPRRRSGSARRTGRNAGTRPRPWP